MERDRKPKQLTIIKKGYKEENYTLMQYKRSPLYILSWVPFAITMAPFMDSGKKAFDYDKLLETDLVPVRIPDRDAHHEHIRKFSGWYPENFLNRQGLKYYSKKKSGFWKVGVVWGMY